MTRLPGDGFTEEIGPDGDVTVPHELDKVDIYGANTPTPAGHKPCDCDPAVVFDLKQFMERAKWRHENRPLHFTDPNYIEECQEAYLGVVACGDCIDSEARWEFEHILDVRNISCG